MPTTTSSTLDKLMKDLNHDISPDEAEALYHQIGALLAEVPDLHQPTPLPVATHAWLARAQHLVSQVHGNNSSDAISVKLDVDNLSTSIMRNTSAHKIVAAIHRALAVAQAKAPSGMRSTFIPVGADFDVLTAVNGVVTGATFDVMIVDAYADASVLIDFGRTVPEGVSLRILADSFNPKAKDIGPAAAKWVNQYGTSRPLEIRISPSRALHDRLIAVDQDAVWTITQSLKDFSKRSPGSFIRLDTELAHQKLEFYGKLWNKSIPL